MRQARGEGTSGRKLGSHGVETLRRARRGRMTPLRPGSWRLLGHAGGGCSRMPQARKATTERKAKKINGERLRCAAP
eukprot:scaffold565_cov379-Pinguiococcus_pyrenoidosus.AAC.16